MANVLFPASFLAVKKLNFTLFKMSCSQSQKLLGSNVRRSKKTADRGSPTPKTGTRSSFNESYLFLFFFLITPTSDSLVSAKLQTCPLVVLTRREIAGTDLCRCQIKEHHKILEF